MGAGRSAASCLRRVREGERELARVSEFSHPPTRASANVTERTLGRAAEAGRRDGARREADVVGSEEDAERLLNGDQVRQPGGLSGGWVSLVLDTEAEERLCQ